MCELIKFDRELNNASDEEYRVFGNKDGILDQNVRSVINPTSNARNNNNKIEIVNCNQDMMSTPVQSSDNRTHNIKLSQAEQTTIIFLPNNEIVESDFICSVSLVSSPIFVCNAAFNLSISRTSSHSDIDCDIVENANFGEYRLSPDINIDDDMEEVEIHQNDSGTYSTDNKGNEFDDNHNDEDGTSSRVEFVRQVYSEITLLLKDQLNLYNKLRQILPECIRSPVENRVGIITDNRTDGAGDSYQINVTSVPVRNDPKLCTDTTGTYSTDNNEFDDNHNNEDETSSRVESVRQVYSEITLLLKDQLNLYNKLREIIPEFNRSPVGSRVGAIIDNQTDCAGNSYQIDVASVPVRNEFIQENNLISSYATSNSNKERVQRPKRMNDYNYFAKEQFTTQDVFISSAKQCCELSADIKTNCQEYAKFNQNQLDRPRQPRIDTPGKDEREVLAVVIPELSISSIIPVVYDMVSVGYLKEDL